MQRVARLLQREISAILMHELPQESMMTVTDVRMTRDLSIAYVYLSVMEATAKQRNRSLATLKGQAAAIRGALARRIRHQLRRIPEIRFFLDESLMYASKMDALFESIQHDRMQRKMS